MWAAWLCQVLQKKAKVLCLGSGNGYEAVQFLMDRWDCYVAELYHPKVKILKGRQIKTFGQNLPFRDKEFDLFFSCETMEHIGDEFTDQILLEAKRVSKEVFFSIATRDDPPFCSHICIHSAPWWMVKFEELGFDIINAQKNPMFTLLFMTPVARAAAQVLRFPDGVVIHARC